MQYLLYTVPITDHLLAVYLKAFYCILILAITFRELSAEFQPGGNKETEGQNLLDIALTFEGISIGSLKLCWFLYRDIYDKKK